ncbi:hypothetical protein L6259_03830 [Candidatus Parcubacteria bacterium]|nr:hypothetical protein [Candidatus Parcubacteria bacterium]
MQYKIKNAMAKIQPKSFGGALDKKIFQRFDFIKKSIPQKQNIFKLFLIAVFCFASFGAGKAGAATTIINPDKTLV